MKYALPLPSSAPRDFATCDKPLRRELRCHTATLALVAFTFCGWLAMFVAASA